MLIFHGVVTPVDFLLCTFSLLLYFKNYYMKRLFAIALCSIALLGCKKEDCQSGVDSIVYEYDGVKVTIVCGCSLCIGNNDSVDNISVCKEWAGSFSKMKAVAKEMIQQYKSILQPNGNYGIGSYCPQ